MALHSEVDWLSKGAREVGLCVPHHPAVEPVVADIVAQHGSEGMNKHVQDFLYWPQN